MSGPVLSSSPRQIPLRAKYLTGFRSKHKGGERAAPRKHRVKIGWDKHVALYGVPTKRTLVVNGRTGKSVMRDAA